MGLTSEVIDALMEGRKIEAIKLLREAQGLGLAEAKAMVEAYQQQSGAFSVSDIKRPAAARLQKPQALPDEVVEALMNGDKIRAIKLLRETQDVGLAEAKEMVEAYRPEHHPATPGIVIRPQGRLRNAIVLLSVAVAFAWALATSVTPLSSLIVLFHQDGYLKTTFTIGKLLHNDDRESGLWWGFSGRLPDQDARLYAPDLADAQALEYRGLRKLYPAGTVMEVWYNPELSDTLYQKRTLRVMPYTPDLVATELARITWWLKYCLLPLIVVLILVPHLAGRARRNT